MSTYRHILAIDTAWAACSVAVTRGAEPGAEDRTETKIAGDDRVSRARGQSSAAVTRHEAMTTGHAERLFPMVREAIAEAGLTFRDLDAVAVTIGPGSFTGVRVGVAAARGLSLAAKIPTLGATSLAPLARLAAARRDLSEPAERSDATITVIQDARRGNVFVQDFIASGTSPLTEARLVAVSELATMPLPRSDKVLTGTASDMLRDARPDLELPVINLSRTDDQSNATALALTEVDLIEMSPIKPLYLRPPDAKAQTGKSLLRQRS